MRVLLLPFSFLFYVVVWIRNKLYKYEAFKRVYPETKVISIGNVSSGGTGKTPMTEFIAKYYTEKDKSVCVVLKGYKRTYDDMKVAEFGYGNAEGKLTTENFGDEALMLLENFPKPKNTKGLIIVSDKKISGVKFADSKFKPDVIIVDDGFQLQKLFRDLDIVMVNPYESKLLLPAGNMREPFKNIKRAHVAVFNHKFRETINYFHKKNYTNVVDIKYEIESLINIKNEVMPPQFKNAVLFCGIGDPVSFKELAEKCKIKVLDFKEFGDHHSFTIEDLEYIVRKFNETRADCILTTQKDFIRLKYIQNSGSEIRKRADEILLNYPLYYGKIKLQILRNEELLFEKLEQILRR